MLLFIYRLIINFIFLISPLIVLIRILKKKEDKIRFKEKISIDKSFFPNNKKIIWIFIK